MRRATTFLGLVLILVGSSLQAQQQTRERTGPAAADRQPVAAGRVSANPAPRVSTGPAIAGTTSNVGSPAAGGRGVSNPIDPYARISSQLRNVPGYRYQPWDLYYCDVFYTRLMLDFGYRFGRDAFWTFAQGYPALTQEAAGLALKGSTQAADEILSLASSLSGLLDQYEAGQLTAARFEEDSKNLLNEIRRQSKKVREDYYVSYLDQRHDPDREKFDLARDTAGLRNLVSELRSRALTLKQDFDSFLKEDRTRVVSVEDLTQPSFKSRSKEIDKLATAIKKSVAKF